MSNGAEKENSEHKTSDEELSKTYEEIFGEKLPDNPAPEILDQAKKDLSAAKKVLARGDYSPAEGSRLGRKIKAMEDNIASIAESIKALSESNKAKPKESSGNEPEYVATAEDAKRVYKRVKQEEREEIKKASKAFAEKYTEFGQSLIDEDEDLDEEGRKTVWDMMTAPKAPFNLRRGDPEDPNSWDPSRDAELNYARAKASLFSKKGKKSVNRGERTGSAGDLSVSNRFHDDNTSGIAFDQLDEFSKDLIKRTGMKEESWKAALKGDTPANLRST